MPYTSKGLWYPASSAAPNVPLDIQALANSVDPQLSNGAVGPGIFDASTFEVRQRQAGATMTVDVMAGTAGYGAMVPTAATGLSPVVFAPTNLINPGPTNLVIAANASGNPRVDQIILRYTAASNTYAFMVLTGTATSGATLDNRSGAASLTNLDLRLADVLVANGASSITNSVIRDRRKWSRGAFAASGDNTSHTIASSTYTIITAKSLRLDLQQIGANGSDVKVTAYGQVSGTAAKTIGYCLFINGVDISGLIDARYKVEFALAGATGNTPFNIEWNIKDWIATGLPSTTSQLFQIAHRSADNTTTLTSLIWTFKVEESIRPSQVNNPTTTG